MARKPAAQIPSKSVVRVVAALLFAGGVALMYLTATNLSTLGWPAIALFIGGLTTAGFAVTSFVTGDPEWILLDLILPG